MSRWRGLWVGALALLLPPVGLVHAGARPRLVALFAALGLAESALLTFSPPDSITMLALLLAASFATRVVAAPLAIGIARRMGGDRRPLLRRWYALPIWVGLLLTAMPDTWLGAGFDVYIVPSASMEPTLRVGERFFAHAPEIAGRAFRRGEVVVFRGRTDPGAEYVKRIIGLPGDIVQMRRGVLHLNGVPAPREPIGTEGARTRYRERLPHGGEHDILEVSDDGFADNTAEFRVPEGELFVLGDNRDDSLDSRSVGFVRIADVTARARFVLWGPDRARIGTRLDGSSLEP